MLEELINQRIDKLNELKNRGIDVYGASFSKLHSVQWMRENFKENESVCGAGRIMSLRSHGKSIFGDLKDATGKIQFYVRMDLVGEDNFLFFQTLDVGDIVGINGKLFLTRTQEHTVLAKEIVLLSKAIRPLPEKWHGLKDVEVRYRKRFLDLIVNDAVREVFVLRTALIKLTRKFFDDRGYMEVETPMMHPLAGGAAGKPFQTRLDALKIDLFLRVAPELYLKKLLVGGFEKIYEINRSFRNEGISTRHNPEFTMLESYTAYADYKNIMELVRELIVYLADNLLGRRILDFHDQTIDLEKWEEVSFAKMMEERFGITASDSTESWLEKLKHRGVKVELKSGRISRTFILNLVADMLEVRSAHPVFVTDIFTELCPLARKKPGNPLLSERFELFIAGMEVANAYSELSNPIEQKERFLRQAREEGSRKIDEDFVEALEYGMPPAGGLGVGIDRLVMLFANQPSIKDVIFFPQLKPEAGPEANGIEGEVEGQGAETSNQINPKSKTLNSKQTQNF